MIVEISEGTFGTDGCGCCACDYDPLVDTDKIITHLKENIKITKEACELLGIDFMEFVTKNN